MRQTNYLRETAYAGLIREGRLPLGDGHEFRIERLYVKDEGAEEIRLSWWKNGVMMMRPMDATEEELINLLDVGMRNRVFTQ